MPNIPIQAAGGSNVIVPAQDGKRVQVLGYVFVAAADNLAQWSTSSGTSLSGWMDVRAGGGVSVAPTAANPWFSTPLNEGLNLRLKKAGEVGGHALYRYAT